jgi:O-antigen/teichoic acid export membrane protein
MRASIALGVAVGAVAWVAAPWLLPLIFGREYAPGVGALQVLALGSVFVFATWILHAAAISINLDRRLVYTTLVGLGANIALNFVLIPRLGIEGAAWATVLAEALTAAMLFVQVRR